MKRLYLLLTLALCLFSQRLLAIPDPATQMGFFRSTLSNALFNVENGGDPDKKAVSALTKAIALIDKTDLSNVAADTKILSSIATSISRTSVSNMIGDDVINTINYFYSLELSHANGSSNQLNGAFPSGPRTAAGRNLVSVYRYLTGDDSNVPAWAKAIANASKKLIVVDKLVEKALDVPPPASSMQVKVTGDDSVSLKLAGVKPTGTVVAAAFAANAVEVVGTSIITRPPFGQKSVHLSFSNLVPGQNNYTFNTSCNGIYANNTVGGNAYSSSSGTATVQFNPASHAISGEFSFVAIGGGGAQVTVTGTFSGTYQ